MFGMKNSADEDSPEKRSFRNAVFNFKNMRPLSRPPSPFRSKNAYQFWHRETYYYRKNNRIPDEFSDPTQKRKIGIQIKALDVDPSNSLPDQNLKEDKRLSNLDSENADTHLTREKSPLASNIISNIVNSDSVNSSKIMKVNVLPDRELELVSAEPEDCSQNRFTNCTISDLFTSSIAKDEMINLVVLKIIEDLKNEIKVKLTDFIEERVSEREVCEELPKSISDTSTFAQEIESSTFSQLNKEAVLNSKYVLTSVATDRLSKHFNPSECIPNAQLTEVCSAAQRTQEIACKQTSEGTFTYGESSTGNLAAEQIYLPQNVSQGNEVDNPKDLSMCGKDADVIPVQQPDCALQNKNTETILPLKLAESSSTLSTKAFVNIDTGISRSQSSEVLLNSNNQIEETILQGNRNGQSKEVTKNKTFACSDLSIDPPRTQLDNFTSYNLPTLIIDKDPNPDDCGKRQTEDVIADVDQILENVNTSPLAENLAKPKAHEVLESMTAQSVSQVKISYVDDPVQSSGVEVSKADDFIHDKPVEDSADENCSKDMETFIEQKQLISELSYKKDGILRKGATKTEFKDQISKDFGVNLFVEDLDKAKLRERFETQIQTSKSSNFKLEATSHTPVQSLVSEECSLIDERGSDEELSCSHKLGISNEDELSKHLSKEKLCSSLTDEQSCENSLKSINLSGQESVSNLESTISQLKKNTSEAKSYNSTDTHILTSPKEKSLTLLNKCFDNQTHEILLENKIMECHNSSKIAVSEFLKEVCINEDSLENNLNSKLKIRNHTLDASVSNNQLTESVCDKEPLESFNDKLTSKEQILKVGDSEQIPVTDCTELPTPTLTQKEVCDALISDEIESSGKPNCTSSLDSETLDKDQLIEEYKSPLTDSDKDQLTDECNRPITEVLDESNKKLTGFDQDQSTDDCKRSLTEALNESNEKLTDFGKDQLMDDCKRPLTEVLDKSNEKLPSNNIGQSEIYFNNESLSPEIHCTEHLNTSESLLEETTKSTNDSVLLPLAECITFEQSVKFLDITSVSENIQDTALLEDEDSISSDDINHQDSTQNLLS